MSWMKKVDRRKFSRDAYVLTSWNANARKWFCAMFDKDNDDDAEPAIAAGEGDDPLEAMLAMCMDLGAIADTGKWEPTLTAVNSHRAKG